MHMHTLSSAPLSAVRLTSRLRWRSALVGQGSAERLDHLLSRRSLSLSLVSLYELGMGMVPMCYLVTSCSIGEDQKSPPLVLRIR